MSASVAFEVAVGLAFTYLIFSSICSGIREVIARFFNTRGAALFSSINAILEDPDLARKFWNHPLITALVRVRGKPPKDGTPQSTLVETVEATFDVRKYRATRSAPSYLSSATFAAAVLDILHDELHLDEAPDGGPGAGTPPRPGDAVDPAGAANGPGVRGVVAAIHHVEKDLQRTRAGLEKWFDGTMDRLSGWYKRRTQWILLVAAIVVTLAFNVSTVHVARELWRQPTLRTQVAGEASQITATTTAAGPSGGAAATSTTQAPGGALSLPKALNEAETLPVGWANRNRGDWAWRIVGWLITIAAICLGAPFWFDLLTRMNSLRSSGPPPAPTPT